MQVHASTCIGMTLHACSLHQGMCPCAKSLLHKQAFDELIFHAFAKMVQVNHLREAAGTF